MSKFMANKMELQMGKHNLYQESHNQNLCMQDKVALIQRIYYNQMETYHLQKLKCKLWFITIQKNRNFLWCLFFNKHIFKLNNNFDQSNNGHKFFFFFSRCTFCDWVCTDPHALDRHYWKSCPILAKCPQCSLVLEVAALNNHLISKSKVNKYSR